MSNKSFPSVPLLCIEGNSLKIIKDILWHGNLI